jgi:hypothetical protein
MTRPSWSAVLVENQSMENSVGRNFVSSGGACFCFEQPGQREDRYNHHAGDKGRSNDRYSEYGRSCFPTKRRLARLIFLGDDDDYTHSSSLVVETDRQSSYLIVSSVSLAVEKSAADDSGSKARRRTQRTTLNSRR